MELGEPITLVAPFLRAEGVGEPLGVATRMTRRL